jgi:hypothetical protein
MRITLAGLEAAVRWERGRYAIEMTDDPVYSFGSADNARRYGRELLLEPIDRPNSKHAIQCSSDGEPRASAVLGASGGRTGVHEHSCVLLADQCLVAVGPRVAALELPDLGLLWQAKADDATCFGLHVTPDEKHVVVHGEQWISKFTVGGHKEWEFSGGDIFTGSLCIREGVIVVTDFNGLEYRIDLIRGKFVGAG